MSDCVQSVSDQCLAKGLIPDAVYKRVLESGATSEDKARTLVLAVKKSTETDERCFELFMNILEQELPYAVRDGLLEKMRREANEKASSCRAVVPSTGDLRQIPRRELARESVVQHTHLQEKLEEAVRQHERARVEKSFLEEKLKAKTKKCEKWKAKFQALQSETQKLVTKEAAEAKSKIAACESEIENLKERVKEVEKLIIEQDMQVKRGRNNIVLRTTDMIGTMHVALESHATALEKAREEMSMREREYKVTIQEKELRIRELEANKEDQKQSDTFTANPPDVIYNQYVPKLVESMRQDGIDFDDLKKFGSQLGFSDKELSDMIDPIEHSEDTHQPVLQLGEVESFSHTYIDMSRESLEQLCLSKLLDTWVCRYPGDRRGSTTFATYSGLKTALVKSGLGNRARDLIPYHQLQTIKIK